MKSTYLLTKTAQQQSYNNEGVIDGGNLDGNNPCRSFTTGGTLVMVSQNNPRTAIMSLTNTGNILYKTNYPSWSGAFSSTGNSSVTHVFGSSGSVNVKLGPSCPTLAGNVVLVPQNETEIDFGQYIDIYFSNIANKTSSKFANASTPLTSSSSAELTNNADLAFLSKNVDKYLDPANYGRYCKLTGTISYTIGLPKIETPRTPIFGIPTITFFAYFEAKSLTLSGSASMIKDPSINSEISGNITIGGTIANIKGGVAVGVGVPNLAEIVTTGGMTVNGINVEGSFDITNTNITATGTLTLGNVGGEVCLKAIYYDTDYDLGCWDETFVTLSEIPLGSKVLYTY